eukprot:90456-Hanusia_phi.AAC.1
MPRHQPHPKMTAVAHLPTGATMLLPQSSAADPLGGICEHERVRSACKDCGGVVRSACTAVSCRNKGQMTSFGRQEPTRSKLA